MNERPDPPTERWKDVDGDVPCSDNFTGHWDRLNDWFGDWLYCNDYQTGHDDHEDVSLLLSNIKTATNGGNSDPTHCHSQTGYLIADLPSSYTSAGYGDEFNAMETILHELGHSFANETGTANEHNLGRTDSVSSSNTDITRTSLLKLDVAESNDSNACGDPHYVTDGDVRYENKWSDCCTDYWN